jgi:hypothetical protein
MYSVTEKEIRNGLFSHKIITECVERMAEDAKFRKTLGVKCCKLGERRCKRHPPIWDKREHPKWSLSITSEMN